MTAHRPEPESPLYDRALLLHGPKRNELLTLQEVRRYGSDSFSDPDFLWLYGMTPAQWHARGVRLIGRTAVECTRDAVAGRFGQESRPFYLLRPLAGWSSWIRSPAPATRCIGCFDMCRDRAGSHSSTTPKFIS